MADYSKGGKRRRTTDQINADKGNRRVSELLSQLREERIQRGVEDEYEPQETADVE